MIKVEKSRLDRAHIGSRLGSNFREGLVNHTYLRSPAHSDANEVGYMLKVSLCQGLGSINRVNPDSDILWVVFIFKFSSRQVN